MSEPARTAEIRFRIRLDEDHLPIGIEWSATDAPEGARETKSVLLSVWNAEEQKAMCIDLWTRSMLVEEMKLFVFQTFRTLADTLERATYVR
ncbi:MAG: gliding motility protein GldC, partial [Vicinamibacteria bacterium]